MERAFVSPRFTDGTFDEALPLAEHFAELLPRLSSLVIEGERGSGLTTTLELLAAQARAAGRAPLLASELLGVDPREALRALGQPGAILFADLSVLPRVGRDLELLRALGPRFFTSRPLVVVGSRLGAFLRWSGIEEAARVRLAPWGRDELLELLGTAPYREHRARVHAGLARMEGSHGLLARARTARWLVDAACRLEEGEPFTRSRIFASFLDELSPFAIALARAAERLTAGALAGNEQLDEALRLYDVTPRIARIAARGARPRREPAASLVVPGLHDFLRAGAIVKKIADGEVPILDRPALPFVAEMVTPGLEERLMGWLLLDDAPIGSRSVAATVLHALGRRLPENLNTTNLSGALLAGADLKKAQLRNANLSHVDLTGARLDEAVVQLAKLERTSARGASFDRAWLFGAQLTSALFDGASFRGATLVKVQANHSTFQGACFAGAILGGAAISHCSLERADFTEASFRGSLLSSVNVEDADFTGADLNEARLVLVDLRRARFAPASLVQGKLDSCTLAEMDLADLRGGHSLFRLCDLSATNLRGAQLPSARFELCQAHDLVLDGADLRGAVFEMVDFHAGSSRSGLLLGKPALEGNMTGFYVEGTTDDSWSSPDSIRTASFRGADLRGAVFHDTDLFRVDFRGAILGVGLRDDALRAGAILD